MSSLLSDKDDYARITDLLLEAGHVLATQHYLERNVTDIAKETPSESELFCKKVVQWIDASDLVLFEVTTPCVEVGYDLATALNKSKPVLVLYKESTGVVPYGLKGLHDDRLLVQSYTDKNVSQVLDHALDWASIQANIRFGFPLAAQQAEYLAAAARKKQMSRASYIQSLLEKEMVRG